MDYAGKLLFFWGEFFLKKQRELNTHIVGSTCGQRLVAE